MLARKFDPATANPVTQGGWHRKLAHFGHGLSVIRSSQCPHIAKFACNIAVTAEREFAITPTVVELGSWKHVQNAATPYVAFSVIHNGRLPADHQISRTRFRTIMRKVLSS